MRELSQKRCEITKKNVNSVQDMIYHICLVYETVFSHFVSDLSTEHLFDKINELFVCCEKFVKIKTNCK